MSSSDAVNLFYRQIILRRGIPFPVEIPNNETLETFAKTDKGEEVIACKNADDMFSKQGI